MIRSFDDIETESICKGNKSKKLPMTIQNVARRKLRMIEAAKVVEDLRIPPGNRLEKLVGNLDGFCCSLRNTLIHNILTKYSVDTMKYSII